jgi:SMI1 / KNR4 family (SUKH-1)
MSTFDWRPFLERLSHEVIADRTWKARLPPDVIEAGWLGFPPAGNSEIDALEARLGCALPPSYRSFLATSNGWRIAGQFVYDLLPTSQVAWFRDRHQDWIDAWLAGAGEDAAGSWVVSDEDYFVYGPNQNSCHFRLEYWKECLAISSDGDCAIYLLNPKVISAEGEWESWFFASWNLGANRYRSFQEMMEYELANFANLRSEDEERFFPEDGIETLKAKIVHLVKTLRATVEEHKTANSSSTGSEASIDEFVQEIEAVAVVIAEWDRSDLDSHDLLSKLIGLADQLEEQWKNRFRSDPDSINFGYVQGKQKACATIRYFLNRPHQLITDTEN